jgi:hypothetical protein
MPYLPSEQTDTPADVDQAWKALNLVNDWIRDAESKTSVVLALGGVAGGALYNLVKKQTDPTPWVSTLSVTCGPFVFATGVCAALALIPRTNLKSTTEDDATNPLFFAHVATKYAADGVTYGQVFRALTADPEELTKHIENQLHANAAVAHRKFLWVNRAVAALFLALLTLGLLALSIGSGGA